MFLKPASATVRYQSNNRHTSYNMSMHQIVSTLTCVSQVARLRTISHSIMWYAATECMIVTVIGVAITTRKWVNRWFSQWDAWMSRLFIQALRGMSYAHRISLWEWWRGWVPESFLLPQFTWFVSRDPIMISGNGSTRRCAATKKSLVRCTIPRSLFKWWYWKNFLNKVEINLYR